MMNKLFTIGTILTALASALPSASPEAGVTKSTLAKTWYKLDQLARFENSVGLPAVAASPIGIYLDVFWQGMSLVQTTGLTSIAGVVANSPLNYAAYSKLDLVTLTQGQPSMMTNYEDSTIDHLDLKSFYYGCALGSEASVAGVPKACTVSIKGYTDDKGTKLVAQQSFGFKPTGTSAQMVKANVDASKFKGLKRVDFFVSNDLLVAGLIDTVSYTVYSDKKF
jgi:hypothetical protein